MPIQHNKVINTSIPQKVTLTYSAIAEAVKINWWLICLYLVVTVAGVVASYFTSGWISVLISSAVAIITFFVGLKMMKTVITITRGSVPEN
jgi:hypothetical protein